MSLLARDRIISTVVLAIALTLAFGACWPRAISTHGTQTFIASKRSWRDCAELLVLGGSRVMSAISPRILADAFGGIRVLNFAFNAQRFDESYLAAANRVLDPKSSSRRIVLGVTPRSLLRSRAAHAPPAPAMRAANHTPGANYLEQAEVHAGTSGSSGASVAVVDRTLATPATVSVNGSFSSSVDWAVVALEIRP